MNRIRFFAPVLAALLFAACGGSSSPGPAPTLEPPATSTSTATPTPISEIQQTITAAQTSRALTPTATRTNTVQPTVAPTATPRPPTPTPEPAGYSFGTGKKIVGNDIAAGVTFRTRTANPGCYWERLSGFSGALADILANENTNGPAVVTITANDTGFSSSRCGAWTQNLSAITADPNVPFPGDGTFIVGVDISPGTWRSSGGTSCYWARLRGFGMSGISGVIANANESGGAIVTISASDKGFTSSRCGTWTKQ